MPSVSHPPCAAHPVRIRDSGCLTAFGDARKTVDRLLAGESALRLSPVRGSDGGESVPLALRQPMADAAPPRWWADLTAFISPLAGNEWGGTRRPIIFTSSNFGIDGLYALGKTRDPRHATWASPHACAGHIVEHMDWGGNYLILSHACVSAQLGLAQAARLLHQDMADEVLVFSFDYVGPFVSAGFHSLKILNASLPAPYADREEGSIGLGDGAAWAILAKDGAGPRIAAQVLHNEMFHFTANQPDGEGFRKALAPLVPVLNGRKFWIKGHGTGTLEAGRLEAEATHALFPGAPLVSWKGALGHTLGSCALVELLIALEAQDRGTVPGTVGSSGRTYSPEVALEPFSVGENEAILLSSNAFGGAHAAMVVDHA